MRPLALMIVLVLASCRAVPGSGANGPNGAGGRGGDFSGGSGGLAGEGGSATGGDAGSSGQGGSGGLAGGQGGSATGGDAGSSGQGGSGGQDGIEDVPLSLFDLCGSTGVNCESILPGDAVESSVTIAWCGRGCWEGSPNVLSYLPGTDELLLFDPNNGIQYRTAAVPHAVRTINWYADGQLYSWVLTGEGVTVLDRDGTVVCNAEVPGLLDLALDPGLRLWVLTDRGTVRALGPLSWRADPAQACAPIDLAPADPDSVELALPVPARRIAAGMNGVLWTSSQPATRLDVDTLEMQLVPHRNEGSVAVTWDGTAWFGGDRLHRIAARGPYLDEKTYEEAFDFPGGDVRASVGDVWSWDGSRLRWAGLDEDGQQQIIEVPLPGGIAAPVSFGVSSRLAWLSEGDRLGAMVRPPYGNLQQAPTQPVPGTAVLVDTLGFDLGNGYYRARWQGVVDAGDGREWTGLSWSAGGLGSDQVDVRVRMADQAEELPLRAWCGPLASPADLFDCGPPARLAEVMLRLYPAKTGNRPIVSDFQMLRSIRPGPR